MNSLSTCVKRFCLWQVLLLAACLHQTRAATYPNILLLVTDDQRADTIAALGNAFVRTPNLDKLARNGFVFRNAYCMGSTIGAVCNPSRHMLLSGTSLFRYNPQQAEGTFADIMNKAGYVTCHIGKRGNTAREYQKVFQHINYLDDDKERRSGHHGRTAADRAIDYLNVGWDRNRPLFMYVAFEGPHDPRISHEKWVGLYERDNVPLPPNFKPFHPFNNGELLIRDERLAPWPRTPAVVRKHLHDYYACISSLDFHIGRIIATLDGLKQWDSTIIVFTSDHGLAIGSHGLFGKQNLYEHSMKSPLVLAGPGVSKGNSDALVYLFDVLPTVAHLVGASVPARLDGRSLVPVMSRQAGQVRDGVFLAYRDMQRAVRQGDWKLIRYPQVDVTQLFNLRADPHEINDLADDPSHAERVRQLLALLSKEQERYGDTAPLTVSKLDPAKVDKTFFEHATSVSE